MDKDMDMGVWPPEAGLESEEMEDEEEGGEVRV